MYCRVFCIGGVSFIGEGFLLRFLGRVGYFDCIGEIFCNRVVIGFFEIGF